MPDVIGLHRACRLCSTARLLIDWGLYRTGSKWPDGYYTEDGQRDLRRFVKETTQDWEAHSEKLAAAREAARKGREPLSFPVSHIRTVSFTDDFWTLAGQDLAWNPRAGQRLCQYWAWSLPSCKFVGHLGEASMSLP